MKCIGHRTIEWNGGIDKQGAAVVAKPVNIINKVPGGSHIRHA